MSDNVVVLDKTFRYLRTAEQRAQEAMFEVDGSNEYPVMIAIENGLKHIRMALYQHANIHGMETCKCMFPPVVKEGGKCPNCDE